MSMELRPEVAAFAQLMEAKLREKDHKGGWKDCPQGYLFRRLGEEKVELRNAWNRRADWLGLGHAGAGGPERWARIMGREAASVANFAMMIADRCGALTALPGEPAPEEAKK